jgi:hypothetical protein
VQAISDRLIAFDLRNILGNMPYAISITCLLFIIPYRARFILESVTCYVLVLVLIVGDCCLYWCRFCRGCSSNHSPKCSRSRCNNIIHNTLKFICLLFPLLPLQLPWSLSLSKCIHFCFHSVALLYRSMMTTTIWCDICTSSVASSPLTIDVSFD